MNTKQVITAAVITLIGSAAFAQAEADLQHFGADQKSTVSRAEVRAEAQAAVANGELSTPSEVLAWAGSTQKFVPMNVAAKSVAKPAVVANKAGASTLSREEVRMQAREYVRNESTKPSVSTGY
jgi:Domain of unknown function (DUF4148)